LKWSGFIVAAGRELTLARVVAWALEMRATRPFVPIGIADDFDPDELRLRNSLAGVGLRFTAVAKRPAIAGTELLIVVARIREASVEGEILQIWMARWQPSAIALEDVLLQIIAHGVRGGKTKSLRVIDETAVSPSTLTRRLKKTGLPGPGWLLRDARLAGAELDETRKVSPAVASLAAGYSTQRDRRRARKRQA
jgi:hypothetical protein